MSDADQDRLLQKGLQSVLDEELRTTMAQKLKQDFALGRTNDKESKVVRMPLLRRLIPIAAAKFCRMIDMQRLAIRITPGSRSGSSFEIVMSAASMAMSVRVAPIAMPTSA